MNARNFDPFDLDDPEARGLSQQQQPLKAVELLVLSGHGIRIGVIGHYGLFDEHPDFKTAVEAARGKLADGHALAFVGIRIEAAYAHDKAHRIGDGIEKELARFEVYPDRVVLVPPNQGGLTDAQKESAHALPKGRLL